MVWVADDLDEPDLLVTLTESTIDSVLAICPDDESVSNSQLHVAFWIFRPCRTLSGETVAAVITTPTCQRVNRTSTSFNHSHMTSRHHSHPNGSCPLKFT